MVDALVHVLTPRGALSHQPSKHNRLDCGQAGGVATCRDYLHSMSE